MMASRIALPIFVAGIVAGTSALSASPSDWDARAAARYLDARMDTWWTNAKVLKTGESEARCISCHTALPYALARPALRKMLGEETPTPDEDRIVDTVQRRLAAGDRRQPFYDTSEDKKSESRGVEAVLNAVIMTTHDIEQHATRRSPDTAAALAELWRAQRQDGAWDWLNFGLEPYEAPDAVFHGATLAAIAIGNASPASDDNEVERQATSRLRRYLSSNLPSQRLFNSAWALLAAARLQGVVSEGQRAGIVDRLKRQQRPDGGWSMAELGTWRWNGSEAPFVAPGRTDESLLGASDGYATGLVVFALRQTALPSSDPAVIRGLAWLRQHQTPPPEGENASWAPWRAHSLNFDREHGGPRGEPWRRMFMSDLATSFSVLALAD